MPKTGPTTEPNQWLLNLRAWPLELLRKGGRQVAWTPEFMGFGNLLFVALWVRQQQALGRPTAMLRTPTAERWLPHFPQLAELMLTRAEVKFRDQRVMPWRVSAKQASGVNGGDPYARGFTDAELADFLSRYLHSAPQLSQVLASGVDSNRLVVNVRRGDYYSVPEIRAQYGFRVADYLQTAVETSVAADGVPSAIHLVSDDLAWCRQELSWLNDIAPVTESPPDAMQNFCDVASARRIVMTNSTFSYWAGFLSGFIYRDNFSCIVAPRFFDRTQNEGRAWLVDERWRLIEDLPGGW